MAIALAFIAYQHTLSHVDTLFVDIPPFLSSSTPSMPMMLGNINPFFLNPSHLNSLYCQRLHAIPSEARRKGIVEHAAARN